MTHVNPNDIMCCGVRVTNTCPCCGATDLYAKHLAERGLNTEPVGESHHVGGLADETVEPTPEEVEVVANPTSESADPAPVTDVEVDAPDGENAPEPLAEPQADTQELPTPSESVPTPEAVSPAPAPAPPTPKATRKKKVEA